MDTYWEEKNAMATKTGSNVLEEKSAVVNIIVKINKGDDPKKKFVEKIVEALEFLRVIGRDKEVAVIPTDHVGRVLSRTQKIQKKSDVPNIYSK